MLLNEFALCHYLLENGFINSGQAVDGRIVFTRHFRRNRNFKVLLNDENGFFVKQPKLPFYEKKNSLKREADVYWLAFNDQDFSGIKKHIPEFIHYDPEVQALITGLAEPAAHLDDFFSIANDYPAKIAHRQAEILAALHSITVSKVENKKSFSLFPKIPNWLFNIETDDDWWFGKKSPADLQLMDLIKLNVDFVKCILAAKEKWKTECLLHNDIRWANFLIRDNDAEQIMLIDWELAGFGDPCWDIAGVLQSYFSNWILNFNADPFQFLKMKPAITTFNNSYSELMKHTAETKRSNLLKSMEFTGVRIIQSCIENVSYKNDLDKSSVQLLQFAFNILKKPAQASQDFLESKKVNV